MEILVLQNIYYEQIYKRNAEYLTSWVFWSKDDESFGLQEELWVYLKPAV